MLESVSKIYNHHKSNEYITARLFQNQNKLFQFLPKKHIFAMEIGYFKILI